MFDQIQNTLYVESLKQALKVLEAAEGARGIVNRVDVATGVAHAQNAICELKEAIAKLEVI